MTETEFTRWGALAAGRIDAMTLGRAARHAGRVADALALANAQMADLLRTAAHAEATQRGLQGASNGKVSEQYRDPAEARRATDRALYAALADALGADEYGLLWKGVG